MKTIQELYNAKKVSAEKALAFIKDHDYIFSAQAGGEPEAILSKLQYLKETGVKDVIINTTLPLKAYPAFHDREMEGILRHNSFFFSADLRKANAEGLVSAIPQSSTTAVLKRMKRNAAEGRRNVVVATVSPMDNFGYLSLSISAIYEMDLIKAGALVILEVNRNFPRTFGDTQVHISQVCALVESDRPIPAVLPGEYTKKDERIGQYIAELVEDGSTLQLGIGDIPNAVAHELEGRKHLGIHTEMFTETMVDLIEKGAVDNSRKGLFDGFSVCSFTLGSQRLYDFLHDNPSVLFKSCTFTNDPYTIGKTNKFVSINAALEMDLTGQAASETTGPIHYSGTGGQSETVKGAQMSKGGKSILAFHSTYEKDGVLHSKIKSMLTEGSVVSTSRNDVDYVVTEYGVAWLCGLNIRDRVKELVKIAHPDFREKLTDEAKRLGIR